MDTREMSNLRKPKRTLLGCMALAALVVACDGRTRNDGAGGAGSELRLSSVDYRRLVDVYAYRRIDPRNGQRRDVTNRVPVRIATDVIIDPRIESQSLFDALGEENPNADFAFRPFDVGIGHEEVVILWDDQNADEKQRFDAALTRATSGLVPVAAAFTGQNTNAQPIPVVPRNAALRLKFTRTLTVDRSFFAANPAALQMLEIVDDPQAVAPQQAFRALPYRVLVSGDAIVLDPTIIGGEAAGLRPSSGLPVSSNNVTANIRLAIPVQVAGEGLGVKSDPVAQLNGRDRTGLPSVIRDFRTGNVSDGRVGTLLDVDPPMIVADVPMGITAINTVDREITLNKRGAKVAVRGRVPFVDGPLGVTEGLPLGPSEVPTVTRLRAGDFITQLVQTPNGPVRVRAEVLMNMDVSNSGTLANNPNLGKAADGTDGGNADTVRVKVTHVSVTGPNGAPVSFQANALPLGADCTARIHYYENVPYSNGSFAVADGTRRTEFMAFDPATPRIDPQTRLPIPPGTRINPLAAVSVRFSEPLDLSTVDRSTNVFLANRHLPDTAVVAVLAEPKAAALSMLAANLEDFQQDGTVLRLNLPMGHNHVAAQTEQYWMHVMGDARSPKDLSGNGLDIFDRRVGNEQRQSFSIGYTLEPTAPENLVGVRVIRFESTDEDGTKPGSPDFFGQFELRDGRLWGAPVTRFSKIADGRTLPSITRGDKNECFDPGDPGPPPRPAGHLVWGPLYTTPSMTQSTFPNPPPNPFQPPATPIDYGGIAGPHNPRGMREMATYREDDFGLGYHDADTMMIDVEQMYWAPWNNRAVLFDQFDRYTLRMGHAIKRPDLRAKLELPQMAPPFCAVDCASLFSGLSTTFNNNPLNGVMVEVLKDRPYTVNPGDAFRSSTENVYTPYPKFTRTFTWRDSRLTSWNMDLQIATGLGGAQDPTSSTVPPKDNTTSVSSPWEEDEFPVANGQTYITPSGLSVADVGDFNGDRQRDMDPIALPLLMEFNLWPDDPANGAARGVNRMHIAYVGINGHQSPFWGYFNLGKVPAPPASPVPHWGRQYDLNGRPAACGGMDYPTFTVHSGGSVNAVGNQTLIDPVREPVARGSIILDAGSTDTINGLTTVPAFNDHLYWAQADFVRRVNMVTFGFFDTLKPNQHDLDPGSISAPWPGLNDRNGVPDFSAQTSRRAVDVVAVMDPPLELQPVGTSIALEVRGVEVIGVGGNVAGIWNRLTENRSMNRQNLLNPFYACEAYRYAMANPGSRNDPRVAVEGMTPYVDLEQIGTLRNQITGLLPRYMNFRLIMENDIAISSPKRPSLKSLAIVYRMQTPQ